MEDRAGPEVRGGRAPSRWGRPAPRPAPPPPDPHLRELIGRILRAHRRDRGDRLVDVAGRAGVSAQYLSEVERGLKDPSSEIVTAVAEAVGLDLDELLLELARARGLDVPEPSPPLVVLRPADQPAQPEMPSRIDPTCLAA